VPYADKQKQKEYWNEYQKRPKRVQYKREWNQKNKDHIADKQRARVAADPDKYRAYFRNYHIKKTYGITTEQYEKMVSQRCGRCDICGREPNGTNHVEQSLVIDHDHETGAIRGLLCNNCNSGMGILGDTVEHLEAALQYLKEHHK
jgi:Autographiviridae endonuclease VII